MAFYVENEVIYITKGDDAALEVTSIAASDGTEYEMQADDLLTLTVRTLPSALVPEMLQIDSLPGKKRIVIRHADTAELEVGRYSADVQLTTEDGKRYTIWPPLAGNNRYVVKNMNNFVIMPEVTIK